VIGVQGQAQAGRTRGHTGRTNGPNVVTLFLKTAGGLDGATVLSQENRHDVVFAASPNALPS
jgi:hypothetical protein